MHFQRSIASVADLRELSRRRLPRFLFDYIDGGSYGEETMAANIADLKRISVKQSVLRDVSARSTGTELFGQMLSAPLVLGPVGLAGLNARRGEVQVAKAAALAGVPFCLSTVSACSIDEVSAGAKSAFWFQLYMMRDRSFMADLLERASDAGCSTLVFTVDMPLPAQRYRDYRSGLAGMPALSGSVERLWQACQRPAWAWDVGIRGRPHSLGNVADRLDRGSGLNDFMAWMAANFDATVTWDDLRWVREAWRGTLVVKGVMTAEDARRAEGLGVDGIVVSNHGGRQLDGAPSTVSVLPEIVKAVDARTVVLVDGGIRSGLDVFRMLGSGAKAVLLGRAWAYGLGAGGGAGVAKVIEIIKRELDVTMALTGCAGVADITPDVLVRSDAHWRN